MATSWSRSTTWKPGKSVISGTEWRVDDFIDRARVLVVELRVALSGKRIKNDTALYVISVTECFLRLLADGGFLMCEIWPRRDSSDAAPCLFFSPKWCTKKNRETSGNDRYFEKRVVFALHPRHFHGRISSSWMALRIITLASKQVKVPRPQSRVALV